MARVIALSFSILFAIFETGTCLKCYECSSLENPTCGATFTATDQYKECVQKINYMDVLKGLGNLGIRSPVPTGFENMHPYCLKATSNSDPTGVIRSCVFANNVDELKAFCDASSSVLKTCDFCDKDYCNASSAITASLPVAFLALLASYLLKQ